MDQPFVIIFDFETEGKRTVVVAAVAVAATAGGAVVVAVVVAAAAGGAVVGIAISNTHRATKESNMNGLVKIGR